MQLNGQPLSTGTGFIAESKNGPVLITNRHNVTGRHQEIEFLFLAQEVSLMKLSLSIMSKIVLACI